MKEYQKRVGINHKLTSAYHPRTNSKVERFNGVIKPMLRKFTNGAIHRCDDFVHAALGFSLVTDAIAFSKFFCFV